MSDPLKKAAAALGPLFDGALNGLQAKAEKLAASAQHHSKDVANDILGYQTKLVLTLEERAIGAINSMDAELAIKSWQQASKSALKKLKVWGEWELHDQFWSMAGTILHAASGLLGEIRL